MKTVKFLSIILVLMASTQLIKAQESFFDKHGVPNEGRTPTNSSKNIGTRDSVLGFQDTLFHRKDDVVWSKQVFRVIDLRDKQNFQLYFPLVPTNENKNLMRIILEATFLDTVKVYKVIPHDILPDYENTISKDSLKNLLCYYVFDNGRTIADPLVDIDPVTQQTKLKDANENSYVNFVQDQYKFLIHEIVFFDRHLSRLFTRIVGIAPIYGRSKENVVQFPNPDTADKKTDYWTYFYQSVLCWYKYEDLRPHLEKYFVLSSDNNSKRMTFNQFLTERYFSSYLLGDLNMNNRMILQYYVEPKDIVKEQGRIETELLNFEQDLWEY